MCGSVSRRIGEYAGRRVGGRGCRRRAGRGVRNARVELPVTLTLKSAATEVNYPSQNTDARGFFTVSLGSLPSGTYD